MRSLDITILCSSPEHPVNAMLQRWIASNGRDHSIRLCRKRTEIERGDILFLVSCSEIIAEDIRCRFSKVLVLHASDLPKGRGWSPHVWGILQGAESITLSLLEAQDAVDSGAIWHKLNIPIPKDYLFSEINEALFSAEEKMLNFAVENFDLIQPVEQLSNEASYCRRRTPEDSRIDPVRSIEDQFDLLRVCDSQRFPAFFDLHGARYKVILEKI